MNDSLTSYLVILGGVVLIGMLAHGAWTARKAAARHPKRAEVEPVDGDSQHDAFSATSTMEAAQQLSGVTMREPGVSRLVSVDLAEAARLAGAA